MSKSDLEIRPIYHFTKRRIEAHISISFVAYSIYKELERLLYLYNAPFSVKKAREIIHNIYQIEVTLPDSGVKQKVLLQMDEEQQFLVNMIQNEISKSFGWPSDEVRKLLRKIIEHLIALKIGDEIIPINPSEIQKQILDIL